MNQNRARYPIRMFYAPHAARREMLALAAQLTLCGPVRIFDGGNQLDVYQIAQSLRRRSAQVEMLLEQVRLSRAFSCYQMSALLQNAAPDSAPLLVFDLAATFYDENVSLKEAQRLLKNAAAHLRRLSQSAPVTVGVRPPRVNPQRVVLLEILRTAADVWEVSPQEPSPGTTQLSLPFDGED